VNHVRWERWRLINEGYVRKDTPSGIWEITEKGREYYEKLKINLKQFSDEIMKFWDSTFCE